jgi:hypothetical protein
VLSLATIAAAAQSVPFEYKLKAVFLLNFAKFVTWPADAFKESGAPLVICVIGQDPFGPILDQAIRGESVQSHPLQVARPSAAQEYGNCHIAFLSQAMAGPLDDLLEKHMPTHTLTVGDHESFLQQGGMINFALAESKVRFVVNTAALQRASFEVSSKLLSLGRADKQ